MSAGIKESDLLLKEYLTIWLEEFRKDDIRKNTYILHERNIEKHIVPYFKNILLKDLKPIMYQKSINSLNKQGYSKRTIEIIHSTMNGACKKAVVLKKIDSNPCEGVSISLSKDQIKNKKLNLSNLKTYPAFLKEAYAYEYNYWIYFKALIETGMRKGEAAALQWTDIDFKTLND